MPIGLDDALSNYEGRVYSDAGNIIVSDVRLHIKRRGRYRHSNGDGNGDEESDIKGPFWYSQILIVRSDWLVQNKPQIAKEWMKDQTLSRLAKLAKKYLHWDYKISPRVARMVVYSALQKMVGDKELEGIDPDDNFYYLSLNEKVRIKRESKRAKK